MNKDKQIAWAQAWNCAAQMVSHQFRESLSSGSGAVRAELEKWQMYFYKELIANPNYYRDPDDPQIRDTNELLDNIAPRKQQKPFPGGSMQFKNGQYVPIPIRKNKITNDNKNYMERHPEGDPGYQRGEKVDWDKKDKARDAAEQDADNLPIP